MDKNDYNKGFTIGRINLKIRRLIPSPPPTVWNVSHVTFLELRISKYLEVAPRILESLWTPGYNFFSVPNLFFSCTVGGKSMNCCYLAFVAELYADIMTLFWDFCFVPGCLFLHYHQPWLFLCSSVHHSTIAMPWLMFLCSSVQHSILTMAVLVFWCPS
jgi:hypothetical protein